VIIGRVLNRYIQDCLASYYYGMAYEYFNTLCDTFYMNGEHFTDFKDFGSLA